MALINSNQSSSVQIQEINLSSVITSASTSVAAQVIVSNQGSITPKFFSSAQAYLAEYGNPNAQISYDVYAGLDYFKEGNMLWAVRAVHTDAAYSAVTLYDNGTITGLNAASAGVADPHNANWSVLMPVPSDTPIALFYPARGPGSYANTLAVSVVSSNITFPSGFAAASATTCGTLVAATYQYQISALCY